MGQEVEVMVAYSRQSLLDIFSKVFKATWLRMPGSFGFFIYWYSRLVLFGLIIVVFIPFLQRNQALAGPNFILPFHTWYC